MSLVHLSGFARCLPLIRAQPAACARTRERGRGAAWSKTGFAFRRQLVIGEHIVDFACTKVRLVVEVDGGYHAVRARHDGARERTLNELGWCVVRVAEQQVVGDLEKAVALITECARCLATWAP